MRLLIVEDDRDLHRILTKRLSEEGYVTDDCYDGEEGLTYAQVLQYDCIILDIMLPKRDGISVLREIRKQQKPQTVLLLTARDSIQDRVTGLDAGADDYLTKPFAFEELLARLRVLLRRGTPTHGAELILADLAMNAAEHTVQRGGKSIALTSKEYALLEYLLRNQGHIMTRSQISDHVWNNEFEYDSNVVDVYIRYLRNKIDKGFEPKLIHTIRGFGYVMRVEAEHEA
ncbi:MAG: response regulator transcription factor [Pygmaiobacter sp.]|nr:response regulator transcription factor [Pygmaiobacter sp.]